MRRSHYRREVTHGELFESINALLGATREVCDRCNQAPKRTRSVISAHSA